MFCIHVFCGCHFGHLSVFDMTKDGKPNAKNIPRAKDIDGEHKIAIYHGGVGNFQVDTQESSPDSNFHFALSSTFSFSL